MPARTYLVAKAERDLTRVPRVKVVVEKPSGDPTDDNAKVALVAAGGALVARKASGMAVDQAQKRVWAKAKPVLLRRVQRWSRR